MRFITLIAKNVLHRPVRTVLTALGLAVAIAAVIDPGRDLAGTSSGRSWRSTIQGDRPGRRPRGEQQPALQQPGRQAWPIACGRSRAWPTSPRRWWTPSRFEEKNLASVLVNGWVPGSLLFRGIRILDGRALRARR